MQDVGFRSSLVVVQVALSLTLLVSGGLFIRSLDRAERSTWGSTPTASSSRR